MTVEGLTITGVEPHGGADTHEVVTATVAYAVDPAHPANQGIVDLDRVSTGPDGVVRFGGDARIIQPRDGGNGRLLLVAANRGRAQGAPGGERRLLSAGWTIAWCGWQWDVVPAPGMVALAAPEATDNGVPIGCDVRIEILTDVPTADHALADRTGAFRRYPAADVDDEHATLTERDWWDGPRRVVARDRWRFAHEVDGRVVADDEHVWLDGGFRPGMYYELVYRTRIAPVAGAGLLAFRDLGAFLRDGGAGDGAPYRHAIAAGGSQSGRFLRQWLSEGLNVDVRGRQVFDGAFVEVAGGRRGEVNHRGAQPALMYPIGFSTLPPFAHDDLLARQRALGGVPRVVFTNSAWEYWLGDASLTHVSPTSIDLAESEHARSWFFAGVDHYGGLMGFKADLPVANPPNPLDAGLLARAAFDNLVAWACDGVEPPPSCVPSVAGGTATTRATALAAMPGIPGAVLADDAALPWLRTIDLGPDADKGVARWPAAVADAYPDLVSAVDADGNEVAGVRLPQLAVPLGTFTGWNPRTPADGLPATLYARCGSFWPFARTEAERRAAGDPRPSIAERYRDRDDYVTKVHAAVGALVHDRLLLAGDAAAAVDAAARLYDEVVTN